MCNASDLQDPSAARCQAFLGFKESSAWTRAVRDLFSLENRIMTSDDETLALGWNDPSASMPAALLALTGERIAGVAL